MSLDFLLSKFQKINVVDSIKDKTDFADLLTDEQLSSLESLIQAKIKEVIESSLQTSKKEVKVPFGKYKGQTLNEIYHNDPSYIHFLRTKCDWINKFHDLNTELQNMHL